MRRKFLTILTVLGTSLLFAGCGSSGSGDKVSAPELTPEQQTAADSFKADVQKNMLKNRR